MEQCHIVACWDEVQKQAGGWEARRAAVDDFNKQVWWVCRFSFAVLCHCCCCGLAATVYGKVDDHHCITLRPYTVDSKPTYNEVGGVCCVLLLRQVLLRDLGCSYKCGHLIYDAAAQHVDALHCSRMHCTS